MDSTWQNDQTVPMPLFDAALLGDQAHNNGEDWEDWLRWDPAADATSPDDTTFHSGSSKNDSPIQDHALPVGGLDFSTAVSDPWAKPLLLGPGGLDVDMNMSADGHSAPFLFGIQDDVTSAFDFVQPDHAPSTAPALPKLDPTAATWSAAPPANLEPAQPSPAMSTAQTGAASAGSVASATPSYGTSPEASSTSQKRSSLSSTTSDAPKKRGGRKRKVESPAEEDSEHGDLQDGDEPPVKKTSHNVIEKRYRNNLNDKIVELRNSVPSLRAMGRANGGKESEDLEGLTPAHKLNKATVMAKATEYIRHLEKRNKTMADEVSALKARLAAVETALGRDGSQSAGASPAAAPSRKSSSASQPGSATFLSVPHDQARFSQPVTSQQYRAHQSQPAYARPPNPAVEAQNQPHAAKTKGRGGVVNKVMLGAMAGVMVMEGLSEQQGADGRSALAAVPFSLFKRSSEGELTATLPSLSSLATTQLIKAVLLVGVLGYLLLPLLLSQRRDKRKSRSAVQLPQAPSLASPVEVRRKAWLTAVQSVWVPKHFLLEVVLVTFKMIQLSVRRLIGSEAFTNITGTSKEEEAARIKAWDIAIDAQLAGGDAEVSYYRLLLTLMESGTLPDSPTRLMQKAVHFRVFFWDVANAGYGNIFGFKRFTEKVGRYYWDSARRLQRDLVQAQAQSRPTDDQEVELLPDHLARLVELDCDEVLSDEMIQRAWNLAWNKPSAYNTTANAARDSVVEDHAIRSPLDAVAAWYTNTTIDDTLADALNDKASSFDTEYYIGLALSVAPPASNTHTRALAAKAVLSSTNRESNIVAALEALPVVSPTGGMNLVNHTPASPDVRMALTLAKLISLCSASAPRAGRVRAFHALAVLQIAPMQFTLLTAVAAHRLLRLLAPLTDLPRPTVGGVEDVAASLRVWVGTAAGRDSGISDEERGKVVALCLDIAKRFGGWDEQDSGYGSVSARSSSTSVEHSPVSGARRLVLT